MRKYVFLLLAFFSIISANAQRSVRPYGRSHVMVYNDDAYCRDKDGFEKSQETPCDECDDVVGVIRERIIPVEDIERITYVHRTKKEVVHVYENDNCSYRQYGSSSQRYETNYPSYQEYNGCPIWNINFTIGSAEFSNGARTNLINVYNYCMYNSNICVQVLGYADRLTGSNEYNYSLSKIRADKVVNELIRMGVNPSIIYPIYNGDRVQPYPFENDWNRCVIIKILR